MEHDDDDDDDVDVDDNDFSSIFLLLYSRITRIQI